MKRTGFFHRLADLLFPHTCAFCGKICGDSCYCGCKLPFATEHQLGSALHGIPYAAGFASPFIYNGGVKKAIRDMKFRSKRDNAMVFGRFLAQSCGKSNFGDIDFITCIPQSHTSRHRTGFNQSEEIAKSVSTDMSIPFLRTLENVGVHHDQKYLDSASRSDNILGTMKVTNGANIVGKRIILVDDVKTTGATLNEGIRILTEAGAKSVYAACAAIVLHRKGKN